MNVIDSPDTPRSGLPPALPLPLSALAPAAPDPKREKRLRRLAGQAIEDFNMIQAGDRVMVCLSGGKDSYTLLHLLLTLQRRAPVPFTLTAVNLDQGQPGFDDRIIPAHCARLGVPFRQLRQDTYSVVTRVIPEGKTYCSLCSRLRRGALYRCASEEGFTKVALGHHKDDIVATFLLNLFFGSRLAAMPPKLRSDDGSHIVIRPLAYARERDIAALAAEQAFPIIPCDLCGSQDQLQRKQIRALMDTWDRETPGRVERIFGALGNVAPSQLADRGLFDFAGLEGHDAVPGWLMPGSVTPPGQAVQVRSSP